ncbi:MAG: CHAP domain-containing protein [Pseudolysinimonas sp.]
MFSIRKFSARLLTFALLVLLAAGGVAGTGEPAQALALGPASTLHSIPAAGVNGVTSLCSSSAFACAGGGYNGTSAQETSGSGDPTGWASGQYWVHGRLVGTVRHNCTTYAQFRLMMLGVKFPEWTSNPNQWDTKFPSTSVSQTPTVGSIAQWNGGDTGHVAYVEKVTSSYIIVTADNYNSGTTKLKIPLSSASRPDNYIRFVPTIQGVATASGYNYADGAGAVHKGIHVDGWAFDLSNATLPVQVRISVDGTWVSGAANSTTVAASSTNTAAGDKFKSTLGVGNSHGFDIHLERLLPGTHKVDVWIVPLSGGTTKHLAQMTVTISSVTTH